MAKVRKRTLPSGEIRWLADYVDGGGMRRFKQFEKRKDADAYLVKVRHDVQAGVHVAESESPTVREAAQLWLDRCDTKGLERSTRDAYEQHVRLHILPLLGSRKLSQVTTPAVHDFADQLRAGGRSPAMVKRIVRSLGSIFGEARRRGRAATNPVTDAKIDIGDRRRSKRPEIPSKAELRLILDAVAKTKHRALIVTALFSGLRASELRGLRWDCVDLKSGTITVKERADAWGEFGHTKSAAGERTVPLAPMAVNALKEHRLVTPNGPDGLVFPSAEQTPLDHHNILARIWTPMLIGAGLFKLHATKVDAEGAPIKVAKYKFHALRHAAASLFIEQKLSPKRVQVLMGHSSIQVTFDTYGHLFEDAEADQKAVAEIEKRLLQ